MLTGQDLVESVEEVACILNTPVNVRRMVLFRILMAVFPEEQYDILRMVVVWKYGFSDTTGLQVTDDERDFANQLYSASLQSIKMKYGKAMAERN